MIWFPFISYGAPAQTDTNFTGCLSLAAVTPARSFAVLTLRRGMATVTPKREIKPCQ